MSVSIKTAFDAGRKAFENFIRAIQELDKERPEELSISSWEDELGRLRMWAGNIGAHQSGQSSLDFRLRDSSHIRQQIVNLLDQIPQRLQDTLVAITVGEAEDIESLNESDSEGDAPVSETQSLQESLATIIDCLFEMSILVRKPAQRDHRMKSNKDEVDFYERYDCGYIRDKFPNADQRIAARLGQAITRRRMYLKYRERHAMKLRQGINAGNAIPVGSDILSETVATNFQIIGNSFDDQASEAGLSETSYAPTLVSGGHVTIPAPPRNSQGGAPFECPYCYFIITIKSTRSWNRHVFNDLQPYVCTELMCDTPGKLFTTKHEWLHHICTAHPREGLPDSKLQARGQGQDHQCVLCLTVLDSSEKRNHHVARHLQEVALFVVPQDGMYFRYSSN